MKRLALHLLLPLGVVAAYQALQGPAPRPAAPSEDTPYARALADLDRNLAFHRRRAQRDPSAWVPLEAMASHSLARGHLSGDFNDYAAADEALTQAFLRAPAGSGPYLVRAQLGFTLHRFDRVAADLDKVAQQLLLDGDTRRVVDELRAALAFQRGEHDAARAGFAALLAQRRTVTVLARAAQLAWKTGAFDEAHALLLEAQAAVRPADLEGRAYLSLTHGLMDLERGALDDALFHFTVAADTFPGWYLPEQHLAEAMALRGSTDAAARRYERLVARTHNPELMDALAELYTALGREGDAARLTARARGLHEAMLQRFPEAACGHALAHYLQTGDAARAVTLGEQNRALRPGAEAYVGLARAYLLASRPADAKAAIEAALATPVQSALMHRTAAEVFEATGELARAAEARRLVAARGLVRGHH
jgi:tetratricopeptide (TPR) repeat protein